MAEVGSTDDLFVATDRSYIGRNLNLLLLFCFRPTVYRSVAIDGSSIGRNLNSLLLFSYFPQMTYLLQHMSHLLTKLQMSFFLTLGIIDTKSYPTVNLIKKELAGATTIKRKAPIVSSDADDVAIDVGFDVDVNIDDVGAKSGGEHVDDVGGHPLQQMIHLLQLMIHLLDTCPEPESYPTCKSIVVTDKSFVATGKPYVPTNESSGAADGASIAINDLFVGRSFWFSPSLTWYCNMYPTGNLSVAIDDLPVGYTTVKF
uniref:Uncharacterized protein n=1 Tax=Solanum tuberosum TaxID=4113 RepID=M0ZKR3_SOLTU